MVAGLRRQKQRNIKLRKYLDPGASVMEIATKRDRIVFCDNRTRAAEVLSIMLNKGIRRVPVVDKQTGHFRGIITTTDMLDFLGAGPRHEFFLRKGAGIDAPAEKLMETRVHAVDMNRNIYAAIEAMHKHGIGGVPVLHRKRLVGIVSESDILNRIKGKTKLKVYDVMMGKPFIIREAFPVFDVARMIVHGPYRRLPVVEKGIMTGIVTPFDLLKYLNKGKRLRGLRRDRSPIRNAMNPNVLYAKSHDSLRTAIETMQKRHIGGLPVVEGIEMDIVGMVTERDVINYLA